MATLRTIKRRITAVQNTSKITSAMRMISAVQLKRAQRNVESARPYVLKLSDTLANIINAVGEEFAHPLIEKRKDVKGIAIISIASDRGLCAGFNNNLFRHSDDFRNDELLKQHPDAKIYHINVGKRTCQYYKKLEVNIIKDYPGCFAKFDFSLAKDIVEVAKTAFIEQKVDKVYIVFNEFKNIIVQKPTVIQLLPIASEDNSQENSQNSNLDYIFEPGQAEILNDLLPKQVDIQLWRTLLESYAAEQAARMMAMENATNNARDLVQHLELVYNKARQAAITKEMLEIVGGAEALKK